jgi:hypothetical protein
MSTIHIQYQLQEGTGATGEPLRVNQWEIDIPSVSNLPLYATQVRLPEQSVGQLVIRHFNQLAKVAGQTDIDDLSVTIRDVVTPDVYQSFMDWWKQVYDPETGAIGYKSEYARRGFAYRYDSKGALMRTFELYNLWPTRVPSGDFNYDSSDGVLIEVPLSCDRVVIR